MVSRITLVVLSLLLLTNPSLGQIGPARQQTDADPMARLTKLVEELRARNRKIETRTVTSKSVVYERRIIRYGLFGRKCRVVLVPRTVTTSRTVQELSEGLDGGIGWNEPGEDLPSQPELVIKTSEPMPPVSPNAAGLRASRFQDHALVYLTTVLKVPGDQLDSKIDPEGSLGKDVYLAIVQREFVRNPDDPTKERSFRVFATVNATTLNVVKLVVQVQQRLVGLDNDQKNDPKFYDKDVTLQPVADDFITFLNKQAM